jgi:hypothetical protein
MKLQEFLFLVCLLFTSLIHITVRTLTNPLVMLPPPPPSPVHLLLRKYQKQNLQEYARDVKVVYVHYTGKS